MSAAVTLDSWIAFRKPNPQARLRLFCFPPAGAGAATFRTWADDLPADIEVCPVQFPGRGARLAEAPLTRLLPLVQALAHVLRPLLNKPFAFFGHSLGALVGFELARQIRRQFGIEPVRLVVSAACAPQIPPRHQPLHALPEREFLEELRRLDGTPGEVLEHAELMQIMLPVLRADFAVYETYEYSHEAPLSCGISGFGALLDNRVSRDELDGWREQTRATFSLEMLPGGHFFLNTRRKMVLQLLAQELRADG